MRELLKKTRGDATCASPCSRDSNQCVGEAGSRTRPTQGADPQPPDYLAAELPGPHPADDVALVSNYVGLPENCPEHQTHRHGADAQSHGHLRFARRNREPADQRHFSRPPGVARVRLLTGARAQVANAGGTSPERCDTRKGNRLANT